MAPKSEDKIDDQTVFLYICLKLAKESGGKVDGKLLGEALNLKQNTAEKRLWRLTKAIEAQLNALDDGSNGEPAASPDGVDSRFDGNTSSISASTAVKKAKKRKAVGNGSPSGAESKKRKSGEDEDVALAVKVEG